MYKNIIISTLFFFLACNENPTDNQEFQSNIKLRDNLSKVEFKEAVIGKWESVFEKKGKENIEYLELSRKGNAKIIIVENNNKKEYSGNYIVEFLRLPTTGSVTLAEVTIKAPNENIILSSVSFDLHNALPDDEGLFLRIDSEPYGVMK